MSCTICPKTKDYCLDPECGLTTGICNPAKVAVLIPPPTSEQITIDRLGNTDRPVVEQESQEEIFNDLFSQYFKMLHERNSWSYTGEVLRERFTITRKP